MVSQAAAQQVQTWPIDRLVFYARNPRKNDDAVDRMCGSIREFRLQDPRARAQRRRSGRRPRTGWTVDSRLGNGRIVGRADEFRWPRGSSVELSISVAPYSGDNLELASFGLNPIQSAVCSLQHKQVAAWPGKIRSHARNHH